jgi:hypothetical protein
MDEGNSLLRQVVAAGKGSHEQPASELAPAAGTERESPVGEQLHLQKGAFFVPVQSVRCLLNLSIFFSYAFLAFL